MFVLGEGKMVVLGVVFVGGLEGRNVVLGSRRFRFIFWFFCLEVVILCFILVNFEKNECLLSVYYLFRIVYILF